MISRRAFVVAPLLAAGCKPKRSAGFPGYAFVANEVGRAVAAVDLTAFAVARYIPIEGNPNQVLAHPSRPIVYVLTAADATVHEISVGDLRFRRSYQVGRGALEMMMSRDGSALWVLCRDPKQLIRFSPDRFRTDAIVPLPKEASHFDLAPDAPLAAVSFGADSSIAFVDLAAHKVQGRIALSGEAGKVLFRSDGRYLMAANLSDRLLSVFETSGGRVVTHLPLALRPENFCVKADGGQLFITGSGLDAVVVVYPHKTPQVAETVLAARAPGVMAASGPGQSPDGSAVADYLFIASPAGDISIMSIETRKIVAVAAVGADPGCISITPDQQYALVLNRGSGDMAVIRVAGIGSKRAKSPSAVFTMIPVGSRPVSVAVRSV